MKRLFFISLYLISILVLVNTGCRKPCEARKKCKGVTTKEEKPVCGCDGVEYANPSYARCHGIKDYTEGECQ